jgi:transcriptional regulator with XRE-family HTH domain
MNAARALRFARRRAGLSQTELARRAGVAPQLVNRIERAQRVPRVDTLDRLLAAAGATLAVARRLGAGVDREPIRDLLAEPPRLRMSSYQREALEGLRRRAVRFVLVGDAAARLHGSPVESVGLDIVPGIDRLNARRLDLARGSSAVSALVVVVEGDHGVLMEEAEPLPWLPPPTLRVENRWIDGPKGFVASIDDLIGAASGRRKELLGAVREEIDSVMPGHRIYRPAYE